MTTTYHKMDYREFDGLVREKLGIRVEFVNMQEATNNTSQAFMVLGGDPSNEWDRADLAKMKAGERLRRRAGLLLKELCRQGHIPEGNYLIEVSW